MLPQLLVLLAAVGGTALILGGAGWLWYRLSRLEDERTVAPGDRRQLLAEIENLEDELADTRRETRDLSERVDFLERLLEAGDGPGQAAGQTDPPASDTE